MGKNLTEGRPLKLLFFFVLPMLAGAVFQQLYNMVDTAVVGKFVGENAVAAVGSSAPLVFLSYAIANGLSMGNVVVISKLFGGGRIHEMKTAITTAVFTFGAVGLAFALTGSLLAEPLLRLLRTDPAVMDDARTYLQIYFAGAMFLFLYNSSLGIYNAMGNTRTPLFFLTVASLLNIVLDLLFVIRFNMGVAGVAWATLIAQGACSVGALAVLRSHIACLPCEADKQGMKSAVFSIMAVWNIMRVGLPSVLQQSLTSVSMMLMQGLVNSYGTAFVAGYTAATKIDNFAILPNVNLASVMSIYTGQNYGAGKYNRIREGLKAILILVAAFAAVITLCVHLFGPEILSLFLDPENASGALGYGLSYMRMVSLFYFLMGTMYACNSVLRGSGDMISFTIASVTNLISRVVLAYGLAHFIGEGAIWWSIPLGWLIGSLVSLSRVLSAKWMQGAGK